MGSANIILITNGNMETTLTSQAVPIKYSYLSAVQGDFTGNPNGIIKLQASCDPPPTNFAGGPTPTHWTDVGGSSQTISTAGDYLPNVIGEGYNWIRCVFTPTTPGSNPGTLNVRMNVKNT